MGFSRTLVRTDWALTTDVGKECGVTYSIDGRTVDQDEFKAVLDQRCLYRTKYHKFDAGPVIPEGHSRESTTIITQYFSIPWRFG